MCIKKIEFRDLKYFLLLLCLFLSVPGLAAELDHEGHIVGINYGPFRDGQGPGKGLFPTREQIREDMFFVRHVADCMRMYAVTEHTDDILRIAEEEGVNVAPGAWLGSDEESNNSQIEALISVTNAHDNVFFAVVGNEAVFRAVKGYPDGLALFKVIKKIVHVKKNVSVPVTTAEPWIVWIENPSLAKVVDFIFVNIHPYWENKTISEAAKHTVEKYKLVKSKYKDKRVIIGETGWPSNGLANGPSEPGLSHQEKFIREFLAIAKEEGIDFFLFELFDEEYKKSEPNEVGPHWGLFFSDGSPKHAITSLKDELESSPPHKREQPAELELVGAGAAN